LYGGFNGVLQKEIFPENSSNACDLNGMYLWINKIIVVTHRIRTLKWLPAQGHQAG
jgi:hypothetical protein